MLDIVIVAQLAAGLGIGATWALARLLVGWADDTNRMDPRSFSDGLMKRTMSKLLKAYDRSRIPLYIQVAAIMRQRIERQQWRPGQKISTLVELEREFEVARVTVRQAVDILRQEGLLQRAADALGQLQVRGLVTTGPAVDPAVISAPQKVTVTRWVRHADVLPHCSAVITHGGHGTVMKALIAGVPLILVPLGRDQPDNAARVVHAGVGIRLRKNASAGPLRAAITRVIADPRYRAAADVMAARLAAERDDNLVVDELEQVATGVPATGNPTCP